MNVETVVVALGPVRVIAVAVDPDMLECWVLGEPYSGPVVRRGICFAPCLPRTTPQTMDKHKVEQRVGRGMEKV